MGDSHSELSLRKISKSAKLCQVVEPGTGGDRGMEHQKNIDI